ncbi:MAG: hypothetical protein WCE68_02015 [Anaerolineales bacterium]
MVILSAQMARQGLYLPGGLSVTMAQLEVCGCVVGQKLSLIQSTVAALQKAGIGKIETSIS